MTPRGAALSAAPRLVVEVILLAALGWAALALWNALPGPDWLARPLAIAFPLGAALAVVWYFSSRPSNSGDWQPDVSRLTYGELNGDALTLHNVRNFTYRSETDFTPRWETRTYDLAKLKGLDMYFLSLELTEDRPHDSVLELRGRGAACHFDRDAQARGPGDIRP